MGAGSMGKIEPVGKWKQSSDKRAHKRSDRHKVFPFHMRTGHEHKQGFNPVLSACKGDAILTGQQWWGGRRMKYSCTCNQHHKGTNCSGMDPPNTLTSPR